MSNIHIFSETLLLWYHEHKRDLPWRGEKDPYKIWISEIILQQTRVIQGLNYYARFIDKFPTVKALANAPNEEVMRVWQGLGYYSRARNIHFAAKQIMTQFEGQFPINYDQIISLKGIGAYTAAAISAIAFDKPHFAIDGNVLRVLTRIYGIFDDVASTTAKNKIQQIGNQLIIGTPPADFTQALMEFGAIHCTPKNPNCGSCPFKNSCYAFINQAVDKLPVKINTVKVITRYLHFFIFTHQDQVIIEKREKNDIWRNLYQFPMIETFTAESLPSKELLFHIGITEQHKALYISSQKHKLTHQLLIINFYNVQGPVIVLQNNQLWIHKNSLNEIAFPIVLDRFIKENIS